MSKNIIIVSEEDRNVVQRADIEAASLMNLITFMINHDVNITNERFTEYERRYQDAFVAFEKAKANLEKKYLINLGAKSWNLNYESCELSYEI